MFYPPVPASELTSGDIIDLAPAADYVSPDIRHMLLSIDQLAEVENVTFETHSETGEKIAVIYNCALNVAVPANLKFPTQRKN